ncbi:uncharacterized protein FYW47_014588 [Aplochiton taeniatus]
MSKTQLLRMLINERLSAAATDIFDVIERTITEYEEEVRYAQRENALHRELFNKVLKPEIKLHRADPQKFTLGNQEVPPEQQHCEQERSPSLDQEHPEPPQIKEEQEVWTNQEGERLNELREEETDTKDSMLNVPCFESIFDQDQTQSSHLDLSQSVDNREGDPAATTSTDQMTTEPDGEDCGVSEPDSSITESKDSECSLSGDKPYHCKIPRT